LHKKFQVAYLVTTVTIIQTNHNLAKEFLQKHTANHGWSLATCSLVPAYPAGWAAL